MLLKGKIAVITGCNRGIGKKILEVFSSNEATVFACARDINDKFISSIENLKKKFNNQITPIKCDLSDEKQTKEAANNILSSNMNVDVLVNNAGTIDTALFQMTPIKKLKEIFEINFFSQTLFTQYILKSMVKKKEGSIIYISSISALDGHEGRGAYSSAKSAMIAQSKVLSRELGKYNIRVNAIAPGLINTSMMKENIPNEIVKDFTSRISLGRVGNPEEIANVVLFLSSELSSYVTGQVIRADGGI